MGLVYGRMNFSESRSRGSISHSSCNPSKARAASCVSSRSLPQVVSRDGGDANSDANSSDSLPTPRVTRQTSRNLASCQQAESNIRRSARLSRGSANGGRMLRSKRSSRDGDQGNIQSGLRRSARVAMLRRLKDNRRRGSSNVGLDKRGPLASGTSRMRSSLQPSNNVQTRRSARIARFRCS